MGHLEHLPKFSHFCLVSFVSLFSHFVLEYWLQFYPENSQLFLVSALSNISCHSNPLSTLSGRSPALFTTTESVNLTLLSEQGRLSSCLSPNSFQPIKSQELLDDRIFVGTKAPLQLLFQSLRTILSSQVSFFFYLSNLSIVEVLVESESFSAVTPDLFVSLKSSSVYLLTLEVEYLRHCSG